MNLTCPATPQLNSRKIAVSYESVNPATQLSIKEWHTKVWNCDFEDAIFSPTGILSDDAIDKLLSIVSHIENLIELECALGGGWAWFGTYGDELLNEIKSLPLKSMGPKPKQKRVAKQRLAMVDVADGESHSVDCVAKRKCIDKPTLVPTPVRARPMTQASHVIASPSTPIPPPNPLSNPHTGSTPNAPLLPSLLL